MYRLPHLLDHLQERLDQPRGRRICLVQQCRDQARNRLSEGLGEPETLAGRLAAQEKRPDRAAPGVEMADSGEDFRQPAPARDRRFLRTLYVRIRMAAKGTRVAGATGGQAALALDRRD